VVQNLSLPGKELRFPPGLEISNILLVLNYNTMMTYRGVQTKLYASSKLDTRWQQPVKSHHWIEVDIRM
jgi:hypothetical protein